MTPSRIFPLFFCLLVLFAAGVPGGVCSLLDEVLLAHHHHETVKPTPCPSDLDSCKHQETPCVEETETSDIAIPKSFCLRKALAPTEGTTVIVGPDLALLTPHAPTLSSSSSPPPPPLVLRELPIHRHALLCRFLI